MHRIAILLGFFVAFLSAPAGLAAQSEGATADLVRGKVHYVAACARCHGVDGNGGEGPSLARAALPRAPDDATLMRIAAAGIPGTAMSGSWWLSQDELRQLVSYVRSLAPRGPDATSVLAGDPARGRALFTEARCSRCHTVGGFGTSKGPDLTTVGLRRGPGFLHQALVEPAAALPRGLTAIDSRFVDYLPVRVVDADGAEVTGARINEDSYTIQLRDARGDLHSFEKASLREIEKLYDRSLMRSYRDRFTDAELNDLVAYLATLTGINARGVS